MPEAPTAPSHSVQVRYALRRGGHVRRLSWWLTRFGWLLAPVLLGVAIVDGSPIPTAVPIGLLVIYLWSAALYAKYPINPPLEERNWRQGELRLQQDTIVLEERKRIDRASIACGWIDETGVAVVRLRIGSDLLLDLVDDDDNSKLLQQLDLDTRQRPARFRIASDATEHGQQTATIAAIIVLELTRFILAVVASAKLVEWVAHRQVAWGELAVYGGLVAFLTAMVASRVRAARPRAVVVGVDGIAIDNHVSTSFISFADVADVVERAGAIELILRDENQVSIRSTDRNDALAQRIDEAWRANQSARAPQLAQLQRGEADTEQWRDALEALPSSREGRYRIAHVDRGELLRLAEDAAASPEQRVAAAVVLCSKAPDAEAKRRVRIAAEACADVDLRAVLEAAAEGEIAEASLAQALAHRRLLESDTRDGA